MLNISIGFPSRVSRVVEQAMKPLDNHNLGKAVLEIAAQKNLGISKKLRPLACVISPCAGINHGLQPEKRGLELLFYFSGLGIFSFSFMHGSKLGWLLRCSVPIRPRSYKDLMFLAFRK